MRSFINDEQIEPPCSNLVLDNFYAVIVDDYELSTRVDDFLAFLFAAVCNVNRAVHCKGEQVVAPCAIHDRQGADNQHPFDLAYFHQVVRCPDR